MMSTIKYRALIPFGLSLMMLVLALCLLPQPGLARPLQETIVSGNISSNTTWTTAGSPYIITDFLTIDSGVVLTIEAGVVVKGNTFATLNVQGHLEAQGTSGNPVIFTSIADSGPGEWSGLYFSGDGSGNLDYTTIRYAGDYNAALSIEGLNAGQSVQMQNTTIANSGGYGLLVRADDLHQLSMSNVTFTGNYTNRIAIRTLDDFGAPPTHYDIANDVTLTPQPGQDGYEIKGDYLDIGPSLILTMAAGSKLLFPTWGVLNVQGHLEAQGTSGNPVIFTSIADSGPGEWSGLYFSGDGSGNLDYTAIRYAGDYNAALSIEGLNAGRNVQIQNTTIANSGSYGLLVRADDLHQLSMSNVTFTGNYINRVAIRTLDDFGAPPTHYDLANDVTLTPQPGQDGYEIKGDYLDIGPSLTLTMAAGSKLLFPTWGALNVQGHLEAQGTSGYPVIFTSVADSGPGEWGGLYFGGSGNLNYSTVRNAYTGTIISGGQVNATCATFTNNQGGVQVESFGTPAVVISNSTISGNSSMGVVNNNSTQVDARYNWWGAADGPGGVAGGSGDGVSSNVQYTPYLTVTPVCGGGGSPSLQITKSGPAAVAAGNLITYTLTVTNSGSLSATNLVITDAIPANANYVSGGMKVGNGVTGSNVVSWTLSVLTPSNNISVNFVVTATETITNSDYRVSAGGGYSATGSVTVVTTISGGAPPLVLPVVKTTTQNSIYTVINLSGDSSANTSHFFYDGGYPGGTVVHTIVDVHLPSETKVYSLTDLPGVPAGFAGDVVIQSDQPVTGSSSIVIPPPQPVLQVAPVSLSFSAIEGGSNPASQSFTITNGITGTLNWTATETISWLSLDSTAGAVPATVTTSVDISGLSAGAYTGTITVTGIGALNSPQVISVTLAVGQIISPTVTKTADTADGVCDADCSLREAIIAANAAAGGVIDLPAGIYTLTISGEGDDLSLSGDLDISKTVTINGAGAATTIIDGNGLDRVFHIITGAVVISGVTVRNGYFYTGLDGGGIYNMGNLTLVNSTVVSNAAASPYRGGGIYNSGTLTVRRTLLSSNNGDGIYNTGPLTMTNSTLSGNSESGVHNDSGGTVDMNNVTIVGNNEIVTEGGIYNNGSAFNLKNSIIAWNMGLSDCSGTFQSQGYNLIQKTSGCTIAGDTSGNITGVAPKLAPLQDNGGPTLTHAPVIGSPALNAGNNAACEATDQRGVSRPQDATCDIGAYEGAISGSIFTVNSAIDAVDQNPNDSLCATTGGLCTLRAAVQSANSWPADDTIIVPTGHYTLTLAGAAEEYAAQDDLDIRSSLEISGAGAATTVIDGGGLDRVFDIHGPVTVTIAGVSISGGNGGGIDNEWGNLTLSNIAVHDNNGSGINSGPVGAALIVQNSAIYSNAGSGIEVSGGTAAITNVTISSNRANNIGGAGLWIGGADAVTVNNSTIYSNTQLNGAGGSGGIYGSVTLNNTILAGNSGGMYADCQGTINSMGYNLIKDVPSAPASCTINGDTTGNITGLNPNLGLLQNNGGDTPTHAPLSNSPALGVGNDAACAAIDQRGVARPQGSRCDIGAFESGLEPAPPDLVISKTGPVTATSDSPITYTLTITNNGAGVAFNLVITDMIPAYANYITGGAKVGNGVTGSNVVSWTMPYLLGSGVWTQSVFVVTATQTITNSDYRVSANGGYSATGSVDVVTTITDVSITGLNAVNDSPTMLGQVTMLTASVTAGSNVAYTWALGDGATGVGDMITHTYPAVGVYTTIVTAGNSTGQVTAATTVTITKDLDEDGVDNGVEEGAPNNGDGNNDSIPDSQQVHVTSLPNAGDGQYVTLIAPGGAKFRNVQALTQTAAATTPAGVTFPQGFFSYQITGIPTGRFAVTMILTNTTQPETYWKYGPESGNTTNHWYEFIDNGTTGAITATNVITLYFEDGERGDADQIAGQITDPGGPGITSLPKDIYLPIILRKSN